MTDYERLKQVTEEIDVLLSKNVKQSDPDFQAWHNKAIRILNKLFGDESYEVKDFKNRPFTLMAYYSGTPESSFVNKCKKDLLTTKSIFISYLDELNEEDEENIEPTSIDFSNVFIVHGHDGELKNEVALLLEKQKIKGVVLSEQINAGQTIIEKFEKNSDQCYSGSVVKTKI